MKPVLFITYYWPPSSGAGVQRGLKFVKYLPQHGVMPVVLTVDPAQASYPGLDPSLERDVPAGVRVVRTASTEPLRWLAALGGKRAVPHSGFAAGGKEGWVKRAMRWVRGNWLVPDARRGWVRHAVKAAAAIIGQEGIGTVVISSPPHSSQLIGLALKKRFPELRWIADLRDPWTDIYYARELMMGKRAQRRNAGHEAAVVKQADALVVVGPSMRDGLVKQYGAAAASKLHVITNGYDADDLRDIVRASPPADRLRITYVGTMAASYAPQAFFQAVAEAGKRSRIPIELRFTGHAGPAVQDAARSAGVWDQCVWHEAVPHAQALAEMAASHLLLLAIPEGPGAERILTGKLFEYLAVQRPVLGLGPVEGDAARIVAECGAGRFFTRDQVPAMAAWIAERAEDVRAGREVTVAGDRHTRYGRRQGAAALAALILGRA
jgi:glycosyltransferase involved in cell wall biosynthesis